MWKKLIFIPFILCLLATNLYAASVVTFEGRSVFGNKFVKWGYITITGSYATGGIALTPSQLELTNVAKLMFFNNPTAAFVDYEYAYNYSGQKMLMFYRSDKNNLPTGASDNSDKFIVNDDNSAASNGKLLVVSVLSGCYGHLERIDNAPTTPAQLKHSWLGAADSSTVIAVLDTIQGVCQLRGKICFGDTLFFDDDASAADSRLMYSGSNLGDLGTIYIPYNDGDFIKVLKKTNVQITAAKALALYFDENVGLDDKLLSVTNGNADSHFYVDDTYSSLSPYSTTEVSSGTTVAGYVYFFVIGN